MLFAKLSEETESPALALATVAATAVTVLVVVLVTKFVFTTPLASYWSEEFGTSTQVGVTAELNCGLRTMLK